MKTLSNQPERLGFAARLAQACYPILRKFTGSPSAKKYNLSISHEYKFIWFRVAKNGTRTLLASLKGNGVPLDVEQAYAVRYPVRKYKHYYKFAVARNPWDRLVSCWYGRVLRKNAFNFEEEQYQEMKIFSSFVDHVASMDIENCDAHFAAQSSLIDLTEIDYLARMETFDEDVAQIFADIGIGDFEITSTNVNKKRRNYTEYYTEELRDKVGQIYKKDIQLFGYKY